MGEGAHSGGTAAAARPGTGDLPVGRRWRFGQAILDERTLELSVSGEVIRLERKPLEVLIYLLHHAGEVVTKDELLENVWPGRVLSDTVLTRHISVLRQALKDHEHTLIRTAHGFGYRLDGDVQIETAAISQTPAFNFKPGDTPPLRPQWKLVERLGTGGHGEAWLARHEKTDDARVFKFAIDERAVASLKREITLYRLLHDSLGERAAITRILEWNLEEAPYFLEIEYVAGRDLRSWIDAQGGFSQLNLAVRLELVAQIAEAVAAAHAVGVLHKDLKPGNVLIQTGPQSPAIKLSDFGSGGVLDPSRLEALGITRMGFTKTHSGTPSTTLLYLAPEVIAGQPFTVKADIYALGVLLYQLMVGNLQRPLAAGWELEISDELLREDVMASAAGDPALRLSGAAQLASRLRALGQRRQARSDELAALARSERVRRIARDLRRTRVFAVLLVILLGVAAAAGLVAHRAHRESAALSNFLMDDVLTIDRQIERPRQASYSASLDRAASEVDARFASQPEAAAKVHWLLGRRYQEIEQAAKAITQYQLAANLFNELHGPEATPTLLAQEHLGLIYADRGQRAAALEIAIALQRYWAAPDRDRDLSTLLWRARVARIFWYVGEDVRAEAQLRSVVEALPQAGAPTDETRALIKQWLGLAPNSAEEVKELISAHVNGVLGVVLGLLGGSYSESEARLRESLAIYDRLAGQKSEPATFVRANLALVRGLAGAHDEAENVLTATQTFYDQWLPASHFYRGIPRLLLARLRLEQKRPTEAIALLRQALEIWTTEACPRGIKAAALADFGRALQQAQQYEAALHAFETSLPLSEQHSGTNSASTIGIRVGTAEVLLNLGRIDDAFATIQRVSPPHAILRRPVYAEFRRVQGLLALERRDYQPATAALSESQQVVESLVGSHHWRTQRARQELAEAQALAARH